MISAPRRELVLVGGGHAHVQVLRRLAMEPPARTRVTLVVDTPIAVYSGMVPGFVAGQYRRADLEIDVLPLARRAGARVILAPMTGLDTQRRRINLAGRPSIPFDVASLDVGSTVGGLDLPGVRAQALPVRPIGAFVERVEEAVTRAAAGPRGEPLRVLIVGGGAGGVEIAFTLLQRLRRGGAEARATLLSGGPRILADYPEGLAHRVLRRARASGIDVRNGVRAVAAEPGVLVSADGSREPFDLLLWVTGAVASRALSGIELPKDERGFLRTRSTLEVEGCAGLFAAGDCAHLVEFPRTPRAGVYAVRQGPVLANNLHAALGDGRLTRYRPQGDFLTLLNMGDGTAIGSKWGLSFEGAWVMRLKDSIDRRFMRRFQVLDTRGAPTVAFRDERSMGGEMLCGGCAAKLGQTALQRALSRLDPPRADASVVLGLEAPDDAAAVVSPSGDVIVSSLDAFPAFTDDPYLVGQVGAVNAVSDLLAKGADPRHALALVALPEGESPDEAEETLVQILSGARAALDPLGVTLVGGHTTTATGLLVGFSVDGNAASRGSLLRMSGLRPGDRLILTKPLGTGVLFHADPRGEARGPWIQAALASMLRPNLAAARVAREAGASAATDVTGFGLAGHLGEMLRASGVSAVLDVAALPALPGALELLARGLRSTAHAANERAGRGIFIRPDAVAHPNLPLLFDPQTSGGLVFGLPAPRAGLAVARLREAGDGAATIIGWVAPARVGGPPLEVRAGNVE
jgi:selenide,water dikinase